MAFESAVGVYNSSPPTLVNTQESELQLDVNGNLKVALASGATDQDVNLVGINGVAPSVGAGTVDTGTARVTLASNDAMSAKLPASLGSKAPNASLSVVPAGYQYETVAASQTAQVLGPTGATGDYLSHVIIQPVTTAAGTTTILDNATVIFTFTTGTLADLRPIVVPIGSYSVSGAWKVTTGANVTATGVGNFT